MYVLFMHMNATIFHFNCCCEPKAEAVCVCVCSVHHHHHHHPHSPSLSPPVLLPPLTKFSNLYTNFLFDKLGRWLAAHIMFDKCKSQYNGLI